MEIHKHSRRIAAAQHGAVSTDQLRLVGATPAALKHLVRSDEWQRATGRVLVLSGAPATDLQRAMVALLDAGPGAVLSHQSALAMWRVPGYELTPLHVSHPRAGIRRQGMVAVLHTSRRLPPHHIAVLDGLPLTTPARSLFDIAATVDAGLVGRALDRLWADRLVNGPQLFDMREELAKKGRRGLTTMAELLEARGCDYVAPASNVESRFHRLIEDDRQPPLDRLVLLGSDTELAGEVDALDREARIDFEVDGDRYHTALSDREADAHRTERLRRAGIAVVRYTEHQVWHEGRFVQQDVWDRRQEGRRLHGAPRLYRVTQAA